MLAARGIHSPAASCRLPAAACSPLGRSHASALITDPVRRACAPKDAEALQHFARPLLCASPRCAHPPAASREPCPGRRPHRCSDLEPASMGFVSAVKLRDAWLPLNNHRRGDQQHKKDRHQYRGHQPLTKVESGIWHMTAFDSGGSAKLSVTDNSQGARDDIDHIAIVCRIARRIAVCFRCGT
jgi:hypothetical protein